MMSGICVLEQAQILETGTHEQLVNEKFYVMECGGNKQAAIKNGYVNIGAILSPGQFRHEPQGVSHHGRPVFRYLPISLSFRGHI